MRRSVVNGSAVDEGVGSGRATHEDVTTCVRRAREAVGAGWAVIGETVRRALVSHAALQLISSGSVRDPEAFARAVLEVGVSEARKV